jgi:hypothetical protein
MNIYEKKYHQFLAYGMLINERGNLFDSLVYFSDETNLRYNMFFMKNRHFFNFNKILKKIL